MMKMEILIHKLLHMFEKHVLMLSGFYLKKFIVKVSFKTLETHFSPLSLLDPLLIQVLNIVVDLVFLLLLLQAMMAQEERRLANDGSDTGNDGGDNADRQQSEYPLSPFAGEDDFTYATQDEDHGSRRAGPAIGVIGKPYRGR